MISWGHVNNANYLTFGCSECRWSRMAKNLRLSEARTQPISGWDQHIEITYRKPGFSAHDGCRSPKYARKIHGGPGILQYDSFVAGERCWPEVPVELGAGFDADTLRPTA